MFKLSNGLPVRKPPDPDFYIHENPVAPGNYSYFNLLYNEEGFLAVEVLIGSTNQTVLLKLDTTTTDRWVNSVDSDFCLFYDTLDNSTSQLTSNFTESNWIEYDELKEDFQESIDDFLIDEYEDFKNVSAKPSDYSEIKSYYTSKQSQYRSLVSKNAASITHAVSSYLKTKSSESFTFTLAPDPTFIGEVFTTSSSVDETPTSFFYATDITETTKTVEFDPFDLTNFTEQDLFNENTYISLHDCSIYGTFNEGKSETFQLTNYSFVFNTSSGDIATDDFIFVSNNVQTGDTDGNNTILNLPFGVAYSSFSAIGVLGLGKPSNNSIFYSLPNIMASDGNVRKAMYSLIHNSDDSVLLVSAVDFSQMDEITLFPMLNTTTDLALTLSSIDISVYVYGSGTYNTTEVAEGKAQASIDITTKNVYFPNDVLSAIVDGLSEYFAVDYDSYYERYVVDTSNTSDDISISSVYLGFTFQGELFNVSLLNFMVSLNETDTLLFNESLSPLGIDSNKSYYIDDNTNIAPTSYLLNLVPSSDDNVILGLDFFRTAIALVVDLEDENIGLAYQESGYAPTTEGITFVVDKIPKATTAPNYNDFFGLDDTTSLTLS